ncbi:MAG: hypothetical protein Q4F71_03650 [Paracoccus sp. (in: a-proteobacteria)]|nr:hypothetical protein [Paracoccus sp. (in: a-proteobacteria)]
MSDLLIVLGTVMCILSIPAAIIALASTRPPRGAAILLVFGIAILALGAFISHRPFLLTEVPAAFNRVLGR